MTDLVSYRLRRIRVTGPALEAAIRLADHADEVGVDAYILYERDGVWHFAAGRAAEIVVTPASVRLRAANGWREERPTEARPLALLDEMLPRLGVERWRVYGTAAFELGLHGTDSERGLAPETVLLHVFAPKVEARFGDGDDWVRALEEADAEDIARVLTEARSRETGDTTEVAVGHDPGNAYATAVATAVDRIRAGELSKVILSRAVDIAPNVEIDMNGSFLRGRRRNTPARSFRLSLDGLDAAGFSPETVVEVDADRRVSTQPLAGTRARDGDPARDAPRLEELLKDPKELNEHVLSVEAACADLERICSAGSVVIDEFLRVAERGTVSHLASRVTGRLADGVSVWDALTQLFPAITASGIPRDDACRYIHEAEPHHRDLYSGAVLTADEDGTLDAALVLRALYRRDGRFWLQAGAGIVADSQPARELDETCEKLRSVAGSLVAYRTPEQRVAQDIAEILGVTVPEVDLGRSGHELGLDSMNLMKLATRWSRPGRPVRLTDLAAAPTVASWVELIPRQ